MSKTYLMSKRQSISIAGRAISKNSSIKMNPIMFEMWVGLVAEEFRKRYNIIAEDAFDYGMSAIYERSIDEEKDMRELRKKMRENLTP